MWALASIREKTSYVFEWGLRKTCRPSRAWQRPCVECPSHSHSFCLVTPTSVNCIHVAMWSVSRTFLSCKTETNSYLLNNFSFSLPSRLSHQPSYFLFLWMTALNRSHKETHTEHFKNTILRVPYNVFSTCSPFPNLYNNHLSVFPFFATQLWDFFFPCRVQFVLDSWSWEWGTAIVRDLLIRSGIIKENWLVVSRNLSNANRDLVFTLPCVLWFSLTGAGIGSAHALTVPGSSHV